MTTATFNGVVLAESDETVIVEGNHYFPPSSVSWDHFVRTDHTTGCPWKGSANYYSVHVGDQDAANAAWVYETPKEAASQIKDHVAFYPAVSVS